jgi:hypothetical protein
MGVVVVTGIRFLPEEQPTESAYRQTSFSLYSFVTAAMTTHL